MPTACRRLRSNGATVKEALLAASAILKESGVGPARLEAEVLLAHLLSWSRSRLLAEPERRLSSQERKAYQCFLRLRVEGCPLQYLTGWQEFMSLDFLVTPDVLIPRADTEALVEAVLAWAREGPAAPLVVDAGAGSGAIAISLSRYLPRESRIFATEVSEGALAVARENSRRLGAHVTFLQGDLLEPLRVMGLSPDAVVSNPPYIPTGQLSALPPEVRREPLLALDGGVDGLNFYRRLLPAAASLLAPRGLLAVEVGDGQAGAVCVLAREAGFLAPLVLPDGGGRERVVIARNMG